MDNLCDFCDVLFLNRIAELYYYSCITVQELRDASDCVKGASQVGSMFLMLYYLFLTFLTASVCVYGVESVYKSCVAAPVRSGTHLFVAL